MTRNSQRPIPVLPLRLVDCKENKHNRTRFQLIIDAGMRLPKYTEWRGFFLHQQHTRMVRLALCALAACAARTIETAHKYEVIYDDAAYDVEYVATPSYPDDVRAGDLTGHSSTAPADYSPMQLVVLVMNAETAERVLRQCAAYHVALVLFVFLTALWCRARRIGDAPLATVVVRTDTDGTNQAVCISSEVQGRKRSHKLPNDAPRRKGGTDEHPPIVHHVVQVAPGRVENTTGKGDAV